MDEAMLIASCSHMRAGLYYNIGMKDLMIELVDGRFYMLDSTKWRRVEMYEDYDEEREEEITIIDKNGNLWVREKP